MSPTKSSQKPHPPEHAQELSGNCKTMGKAEDYRAMEACGTAMLHAAITVQLLATDGARRCDTVISNMTLRCIQSS
jgi:hypothetical protein